MASSFAQGFQMGGSMYDSAERMKLAKEQQEWAREDAAAKRAERQLAEDIRTAGAETISMEGKPLEYLGGTGIDRGPQPANAQTALRPDIATAPAKMYSADQAQQDYLRRLRGLDVGKAQQYEKSVLELGELQRGKRYADKQELALGFNNQVIKDLTDAQGDAAAVIEKTFIPLYNDDKLPGFKDGGKAKLVPSALGGDKSIVITYKDGKQETLPADLKTLQQLSKYTQDQMMQSSTPENYWKAKSHALEERKTTATETSAAASVTSANAAATNAKTNADKLAADLKAGIPTAQAAEAWAKVRNYNADADLRAAQAKAMKEKTGLWQLVGTDDDGQPISYDRNTGNFARPDAQPIKNVEVFKRLSGEKVAKEPISNKDIIDFVDKFGESPSNEKDKKTGKAIPIRMLPPAKQRAYAEDFFQKGTGTGAQGGLKDDVKPEARNPEAPAAPAKSALPRPSRPAAASGVPAETPMPTSSVVYGKTVYKMPGMLAGFNTPEEAQAAWAQKNAPLAPQTFD